ncbi:hypothetical protein [Zobellia laminariae]
MFYRFESASRFALNSFERLQEERLKEAIADYNAFKKQFPESEHAGEAEKILEKVKLELQGFTQAKEAK